MRGIVKVVIGGLVVLAVIVVAALVLNTVLSHPGAQKPSRASGNASAPSSMPSTLPPTEATGMSGSWVPAKGSVDWTDTFSQVGYGFSVAASPPGGLFISGAPGHYAVVLVSSDGSRYATTTKTAGDTLDVYVSVEDDPGTNGLLFSLKQRAPHALAMYGFDAPHRRIADFKPGDPTS